MRKHCSLCLVQVENAKAGCSVILACFIDKGLLVKLVKGGVSYSSTDIHTHIVYTKKKHNLTEQFLTGIHVGTFLIFLPLRLGIG